MGGVQFTGIHWQTLHAQCYRHWPIMAYWSCTSFLSAADAQPCPLLTETIDKSTQHLVSILRLKPESMRRCGTLMAWGGSVLIIHASVKVDADGILLKRDWSYWN